VRSCQPSKTQFPDHITYSLRQPPHPNADQLNITGYLLVYPKREDVQFLADSEAKLKQYFFGQKRKPHLFCADCSSNVMIDFAESESEKEREVSAVNVSGSFLRDVPIEMHGRKLIFYFVRSGCSKTLIWRSWSIRPSMAGVDLGLSMGLDRLWSVECCCNLLYVLEYLLSSMQRRHSIPSDS
jgi:hypothetical protein